MSMSNAMAMARNRNVRMAAVGLAPNPAFARLYNWLTGDSVRLLRDDHGFWVVRLPDRAVKLTRPKDALRVTHIGDIPERRVYDRYTMPDAFEPEPGDSVVDVGPFIGEFSWWVQRHRDPSEVFVIDPDPRACHCCLHNIPGDWGIRNVAAGDKNGGCTVNIARDGSESSVLEPDNGGFKQLKIGMRRVDGLVDECDFLKIDAEGFEPEVLEGVGDLQPGKVAVDVSPERDGESTASECTDILEGRGYVTKCNGDVLYAWL